VRLQDTGPATAYSHAGTRHDAEWIRYVLMPGDDAMRWSMRAASLMAQARAWIEEVGAS
jgi:hypothetical protein